MLWKASDLKRFSLRAKDGVLGDVEELYFSDDTWTVRYLVAATGDWLGKRRVLVSPMALSLPNAPAKVIPVELTREQIEKAPPVEEQKPVSRQYETRYYDHYGWPYYWMGGPLWGPYLTPGELARARTDLWSSSKTPAEEPAKPHLRRTEEVRGYRFEGSDGKLGHIEDFIINDESWTIRYLVIDTRQWWPGGKKVLLARSWIREVSWAGQKVTADVSRDSVKSAPEYEESAPLSERYERELARHYGLEHTPGGYR